MSNNRSDCINRDYNATLNIKKITRHLLKHKVRPENYRRTNKPLHDGQIIGSSLPNSKRVPIGRLRISSSPYIVSI